MNISTEKINEFVAKIAKKFKPEKIILFGSHGYDTPGKDSDVDMLVIIDSKKRPVDLAIQIRSALRAPFPVDILVRTPEQIEKRLSMNDFFIREILTKGKILYERNN
jgi:predicted nucleotidyltransferase